jgi:tripartite-type tricarboxylate transporter receptor subunit TctC
MTQKPPRYRPACRISRLHFGRACSPCATPPVIVKKLEKELMEIVKLPAVQERLKAMAVEPSGDLASRIAAEIPRRKAIAKAATSNSIDPEVPVR